MNTNKIKIEIIVDWLICFVATIYLTYEGVVEKWPLFPIIFIWSQWMGLNIFTFIPKLREKYQIFVLSTFMCTAVSVCGVYQANFSATMILFIGTVIMMSFYQNWKMVVYQGSIDVLAVIVLSVAFKIGDFTSSAFRLQYYASIVILISAAVAMIFNIVRNQMVQKNLEETAETAMSAERSKSDFLANMSHEIRTPMNAIIGMCELALRENNLSEAVREYCHSIQNSGRSLLSIINDILDFSKIESGKLEIIEDEFNIASTLNDVINMANTRMGDKRLEFIVIVDPTIPKGLIGDELRIRQVMINILTNAIKYSESGVVTLKVTQVVRDYGINLTVSVKDTGIGITPENLEKLFTSFQQVDTKKNRAVEGTGLGLVITKRLLKAMGGFISVSSEYGQGSEFKFVIPLKVKDRESFIHVHNSDDLNVVAFIDVAKYNDERVKEAYGGFLRRIGHDLHVKYSLCHSMDRLKQILDNGGITHLFVGREEYIENQEFFDVLSHKVEIVVVQARRDAIPVPSTMKNLFKPFYALSLAGVLNNESVMSYQDNEKSGNVTFIAPRARVLVVDDNSVNLQVAVGLMQPYKMQVLTVESGKDAIRLLGSKDYDIIFMDHMMPEMDGVEATKIIRSMDDEYFKKVPIIALTANAVNGAREMFLANGFNGFLAKPIELSALDRILKQNLPAERIQKMVGSVNDDFKEEKKELIIPEGTEQYINTATGLTYAGGSRDAYMSILEIYVKKGQDKTKQFADLYAKQDWKNYIIEAHALKSSSLSIGSSELSEIAKELELKGKAGDYQTLIDKNDVCMELYKKVVEAGRLILSENTEQVATENIETNEIGNEQLLEYVEKIKAAIEVFDGDEIISLSDELSTCICNGKELSVYANKFKENVGDFEFDKIKDDVELMVSEVVNGGEDHV